MPGVGQSQPITAVDSRPTDKNFQSRGEGSRLLEGKLLSLPLGDDEIDIGKGEHLLLGVDNSPKQENPLLMGTCLPLESVGFLIDIGGTTTCRCERPTGAVETLEKRTKDVKHYCVKEGAHGNLGSCFDLVLSHCGVGKIQAYWDHCEGKAVNSLRGQVRK
ncbi:hypothetical protein E3N88_24032 [Mikania micrantha]|uniref:Uncharacterized protein n=1 Tax=Mikania micrantha TaxID=192012 RepID=A0A5N6NEY0_9ASTR|nr:hypothetical protein E3N88_24032 [Mikania micrantha]